MTDMGVSTVFLFLIIVPCLAVALRIAVTIARRILGPAKTPEPELTIESSARTTERDESNPYSAPQDVSVSRLAFNPELSFGKAYAIAAAEGVLLFLLLVGAGFGMTSIVLSLLIIPGIAFPVVVGMLQLTTKISFGRAVLITVIQYSLVALVIVLASVVFRFALA